MTRSTTTLDELRELLIENTDALVSWMREAGDMEGAQSAVDELDRVLAAQPSPAEALRLLEAIVKADDTAYGGTARHNAIDEARRFLSQEGGA